jgi:hypothetical protein
LIEAVVNWSRLEAGIAAVVLVGSHARGDARPDSDIDLVLLCADPQVYLKDKHWVRRFGQPASIQQEVWGNVTSLRVRYAGLEVEFGLTSVDWAADPEDLGVAEVVRHGARILLDRDGVLAGRVERLLARFSAGGP